jgi:hypothetical protein
MKTAVPVGLIGLGLFLLALSGLWPKMFPGTAIWTPEKAERWAVVKDRLHNLSFVVNRAETKVSMHAGGDPSAAKTEYEQLKLEGAQLKADFETAANRPSIVSKYLKWTGMGLAIVGLIGWYAVKQTSS